MRDARGLQLRGWFDVSRDRLSIVVDDRDATYPIAIDPLATSPAWTAESNQAGALFGFAVATAGDVNGDGYDDVVVGAPQFDNGENNEGRAFVYYGSAAGLSVSSGWTAEGDQADAAFGLSLGTAGDVNGDGFSDVIVGARGYDHPQVDEGRVYVYHGSASGLSVTANWTAESDSANATFGRSVGTAGDVNHDGFSDVIVGAPHLSRGQSNEGGAFVYLGSAGGLSSVAVWTVESDQADAEMGIAVGTAGDVNGDGYDDVIVGAYTYDNGQLNEGRAFVYQGSASGPSATPAWTEESNQADADFGTAVGTAGDVNGDGYADVIVSAYAYDNGQVNEGRAYVYHGSASGLGHVIAWSAEGDQTEALFGIAAGTAGDVDGDGYSDVIVGAYLYDHGQTNEGQAYVYFGSASGLSTVADWTAENDQSDAGFGVAVASAGDVNGDGLGDVVVGSHQFDNGQVDEGRAFLYLGASGVVLTVGNASVAEGNAGTVNATFTVSLSKPSDKVVTVSYATANGTATTANNDYVMTSGTLTIPAHALSAPVSVTVNGDLVDESNETFFLNLSNPVNATIGNAQGQGTILDDDGLPKVSIDDVAVTEGNSGTTNATFTVSLSNPSGQDVTVHYATEDGEAIAGSDYVATSGTLTIPAKTLSATLSVPVIGDVADCVTEPFLVRLSAPSNASIGDDVGVGLITDDDGGTSTPYWTRPAINLSWDDCMTGPTNKSFACDTNSGLPFTMVVSFVAPPGIDRLKQLGLELEIISDSPALPDWWELTECRLNSLTVNADFTSGPINCSDYWEGQAIAGKTFGPGFGGSQRALLFGLVALRSGAPIGPLASGQEYYTLKVSISRIKSTGVDACAGCSTPVTIVLRFIQLVQTQFPFNPVLVTPMTNNVITWQGGVPGPFPGGNFRVDDVTVSEDASQAVFTVSKTSYQNLDTVSYSTSDGSATAGQDYVASSGTVQFVQGQGDTAKVAIPLIGDGVHEGPETFHLNLSCEPPGSTMARGSGLATLIDNDVTGVPPSPGPIPAQVTLEPAEPNPMRSEVVIPFGLPRARRATLKIFDLSGRLVRVLADGSREAGTFRERWDGTLRAGVRAAPGMYVYELRSGGVRLTRHLVVVP